MACKSFHEDFPGHPVCYGTKERESCRCGGDESKCDFYEHVREKAKREQTESLERESGERVYNPVYKCRLCGEKFHKPMRLVQNGKSNSFKNELLIAQTVRHTCGDDMGIGCGDLIGFVSAQSEKPHVECDLYDQEETHKNCTVQVLTNTATGEVSVGWWKNTGPDVDFICRVLAEHFDNPCGYTIDGVDIPDILCTDEWCDGCNDTHESSAHCWKRFFEIWKERESNG